MYAADSQHENSALQEKLRHLYSLRGGPTIDLTIRPAYYELLRRLGDPHLDLPPVIHVAGTNGKGSTIAMLRAMLEAAGKRVHVYTSPHLLRFNERIVLAGREIDDNALESLLDEVTALNGDLPLTFFEITTALAFTAFARTPADIVLLETGLGGRLDSTNVIDRPLATIITSLGLDHQEFLGETLPQIASEKAGIIKPGVPCFVAPQVNSAVVLPVFTARAKDRASPLYRAGEEWRVTKTDGEMIVTFGDERLVLPLPVLTGPHQTDNAATAVACLHRLGIIPAAAMAAGLRKASWPGRLQKLTAPAPGWELWLDGAHNENGAQALAAQLAQWREQDARPLHLVFGIMQRKDVAAFLRPLLPYATTVTAVPIAGEALAHTAATLQAALRGSDIPVPAMAVDLAGAVKDAAKHSPPGRILIAGSLYLVAQALRQL